MRTAHAHRCCAYGACDLLFCADKRSGAFASNIPAGLRARVSSGFLSRRWGLPPPHPRFPLLSACLADGSLPRATKCLAGGGCRPRAPAFRCSRLVLQTARCRGQRSAWRVCIADDSLPRTTKRLKSCARTCARVSFFAAGFFNDGMCGTLIAAAALAFF
jgi:hypothetical protein